MHGKPPDLKGQRELVAHVQVCRLLAHKPSLPYTHNTEEKSKCRLSTTLHFHTWQAKHFAYLSPQVSHLPQTGCQPMVRRPCIRSCDSH